MSARGRSSLLISLAIISLLAFAGCVRQTRQGDAITFSNELWVPLLVLMGGLVAGVAGWFLRQTSGRLGWGLLIVGPLAAIVFAPSLLLDRATIDSERFTVRTGIWGFTAVHEVRLADLTSIRLTKESHRGRRGRRSTSYYCNCQMRDGASHKIPQGNEVAKQGSAELLKFAAGRGIPIIDETGD